MYNLKNDTTLFQTIVQRKPLVEIPDQVICLNNLPLTISKNKDGSIILSGTFKVNVDDFNIEIPKVVSNKLSKTVAINFNFVLTKK